MRTFASDDPRQPTDGTTSTRAFIRRQRIIFVVLLFGWLHSLFYVVELPPWDLLDEEQHLSYVLTLRDERRPPHLNETIQPAIVDSAITTNRWDAFRLTRPADVSTSAMMGLEGRSYEAYQPPLYYSILAILTIPAGDDVLRILYLARVVGSLLFVVLLWLTWALACAWFPGQRTIHAGAALFVAAIPAAAQAGARVSNDLLAAVLITGAMLALTRFVSCPILRWGATVGLLAAAGLLTKSHSLIALPVIAVGLVMLWRNGRLSVRLVGFSVVPSIVAVAGWTLWIYRTYGVLDGTSAYLERYQTYQPLPWDIFPRTFWLNAWSDYWGAYGGGDLLVPTNLLLIAIITIGIVAIARIRAAETPVSTLFTAILVVALLTALIYANQAAIVRPSGRLLLPAYPALATLIVAGWSRLGAARLVWVPVVAVWLAALAYIAGWFIPFF